MLFTATLTSSSGIVRSMRKTSLIHRGPYRCSAATPAFCRVAATLKPTPDSDIKVEFWMPEGNWNRKYEAVGNGGWAGAISYSVMADALRRGYATCNMPVVLKTY